MQPQNCDVYFKDDGVFVLGWTKFGGGSIGLSLRDPVLRLGTASTSSALGQAVRQTLDLSGSPLTETFRGWYPLDQNINKTLHAAGIKSWTTLTTSSRSFSIEDDGTRVEIRTRSYRKADFKVDEATCGRDREEIGRLLLALLPSCPTSDPVLPARAGSSYHRERSEIAQDGGLPKPFGCKYHWIVIDTSDTKAVAAALGLRDVRPTTWDINPYDPEGVFISPSVLGWTFVLGLRVGFYYGLSDLSFFTLLEGLSRRFGEVQYFATHRGVGLDAWVKAVAGRIIRVYCESENGVIDQGELTLEEEELGFSRRSNSSTSDDDFEGIKLVGEEDVMRLAGKWSINPQELDAYDSVGAGFIGKEPAS